MDNGRKVRKNKMSRGGRPTTGIYAALAVFVLLLIIEAVAFVLLKDRIDSLWLLVLLLVPGLAAAVFADLRFRGMQRQTRKIVSDFGRGIGSAGSEILQKFKLPVLIADNSGRIIWYNNHFEQLLEHDYDLIGEGIADRIMSESDDILLKESGHADIMFGGRMFAVYQSGGVHTGRNDRVLYFVDQTELRSEAEEYRLSRPAVILISVDNMDEMAKAVREGEKGIITSSIQMAIENWAGKARAIVKKISSEKFFVIMEDRDLEPLMEDRFKVLDSVRKIKFGDAQVNATLSIGVGRLGENLEQCEQMAQQALEMAIGRDGDQAAVKTPDNEYQFFGGVAKAVERKNKARARLMASVLIKLIDGSDRVVIMGHKFSDMDCIGPALALWYAAKNAGKEAHIVVDERHSLATGLIEMIKEKYPECDLTDGNDLLEDMDQRTLLIAVDVQRPSFLDNRDLYERATGVVVIDHHRKAVEHIDNAMLFYHETSASSTSEIVAEMMQYIGKGSIPAPVAQGLLTGIMLDTKNYVLHTGARTFEASAYLRQNGANPQLAKQMLCGDIDTYRQRAAIMATAEYYGDCAIAVDEIKDKNSRLATSQAADELLNIKGVRASFVMCYTGDGINISARSAGEINVQVIMEALGGGGHGMMAACQIDVESMEQARRMLFDAIDNYKKHNGN